MFVPYGFNGDDYKDESHLWKINRRLIRRAEKALKLARTRKALLALRAGKMLKATTPSLEPGVDW